MEGQVLTYPSIKPSSSKLSKKLARQVPDIESYVFCAVEKIHGSNFSAAFAIKGGIQAGPAVYCKRTGPITEGDHSFFGYRDALGDQPGKLEDAVARILSLGMGDVCGVQIFGEIYGGYWPGEEKEPPGPRVQKGVYYASGVHIMWFDIAVTLVANLQTIYLGYKDCLDIFKAVGLPYPFPVRIGTFGECIAFSVEDFYSCVYVTHHGIYLPWDARANVAEGVVIRIYSGEDGDARMADGSRIMFKKKSRAFLEEVGHSKIKRPEDMDDAIFEGIQRYLTPQRLNNIASHYTPAEWDAIRYHARAEMLLRDATKAYEDDMLAAKESKGLKKRLKEASQTIVKYTV